MDLSGNVHGSRQHPSPHVSPVDVERPTVVQCHLMNGSKVDITQGKCGRVG